MDRDSFISSGVALYGPHWRARMAECLGVERSSVTRWASGAVRVPPVVALAVELLVEKKQGVKADDTHYGSG